MLFTLVFLQIFKQILTVMELVKTDGLKICHVFIFGKYGEGEGVSSYQLIDIIKDFCLMRFPDFVRFLLVDAYNEPAVIGFYQKNKFTTVFSTEEQEKETYRQTPSEPLQTRYMFYDMIQWRNRLMR